MSPSGLQRLIQSDFQQGIQPSVARHLIGESAIYDAQNGLFDDLGSIYRRGGSTYRSGTNFGTVGLRWGWDGHLAAGMRTLIANSQHYAVEQPSDSSAIQALAGTSSVRPYSAVECEGMLFIGGATPHIYAGSLKSSAVTSGTVSVTQGTKVVTRSAGGADWSTTLDAGMLMQFATDGRVYVVASVDSNTQVTLRDNFEETTIAGGSYTAYHLYPITANDPYLASYYYAVAGNRLLAIKDNRMHFSGIDTANQRALPHSWGVDDYHGFDQGVELLGLDALADAAVVFTNAGIFLVQGLALELVDDLGNPQHRVDQINKDIALWHYSGVASWSNALIVPSQDAVYLFDPARGVTSLSQSIEVLYRRYVEEGYRPGQAAVYQEHYFLPILDASNATVDVLVCRLDRPYSINNRMTGYPWTRLTGYGAVCAGYFVRRRTDDDPDLIGLLNNADARTLNCSSYFYPGSSVKADPDGTAHNLVVITRDFRSGPLNLNRCRKVRLHYDLQDASNDDPVLYLDSAQPGIPSEGTLWGHFIWGEGEWTDGQDAEWDMVDGGTPAPETTDRTPFTWPFNKRLREVRFRVRSSGPCAKLSLRHLELYVAASLQTRR